MIYDFKRKLYYDMEESIRSNKVTFLLGARKCGKTVCLEQLAEDMPNAIYCDAKQKDEDDMIDLFDEIKYSIEKDYDTIYLIDEVTYLSLPEKMIAGIAEKFAVTPNSQTKVVFTGSQSKAIESWGRRAFGGNAGYVHGDFIEYPEWLAFKGIKEVSEDTYAQYVMGMRDFYSDFTTLDDYLKGCIDETIISNLKTSNVIWNNDCKGLSAEMLKTLMYATLISLKNRPTLSSFFNRDQLFKDIRYSLKEPYRKTGKEDVEKKIDEILNSRFYEYQGISIKDLKNGLVFLYNTGLITLTDVESETSDFEKITDIYRDFTKRHEESVFSTKGSIFENINICVKHPMFYVEIIKEILGDNMPEKLPGDLMGGIVECHVRGLLSQRGHYEYHDDEGREIDYVNYIDRIALESSIRNKSTKETSFDVLPSDFRKILLTKDENGKGRDGIERIPYYKFIYRHSGSKTLHKTYIKEHTNKDSI